MLTLFHAPQSRSGRIVWLLEEIGVAYDIHQVDIFRAMTLTGTRDPANIHPDGKVPALVHDGALVTESAAIALYLTDLHPHADLGAPVGSPDRAAYLTWLAWTAGEMEPGVWSKISGAADTDTDLAASSESTSSSAPPWTNTSTVSDAGRSRYLRTMPLALARLFQVSTSRMTTTRRSAIIGSVLQLVSASSGSRVAADRWSKLKSRSDGSSTWSRIAVIASSFNTSSGPCK